MYYKKNTCLGLFSSSRRPTFQEYRTPVCNRLPERPCLKHFFCFPEFSLDLFFCFSFSFSFEFLSYLCRNHKVITSSCILWRKQLVIWFFWLVLTIVINVYRTVQAENVYRWWQRFYQQRTNFGKGEGIRELQKQSGGKRSIWWEWNESCEIKWHGAVLLSEMKPGVRQCFDLSVLKPERVIVFFFFPRVQETWVSRFPKQITS